MSPLRFVRAAETSTVPSISPAGVLIGEVQWSGSSRSTADEWLELWNVSDTPVELGGWSLVGASEQPMYFSSSHIIQPRHTLLLANYSATTTDKTLLTHQTVAIATSSLSLSNDRLLIELRDGLGLLRDSAGTGAKPPAGTSSPTNTSMMRVVSSTGWIWRSATSTFFEGAPDLGSPGICDECVLQTHNDLEIPPIEESEPIQQTESESMIEDIEHPEASTSSDSTVATTTVNQIESIIEEPASSYEISSSTPPTVVTTTHETPPLETPLEENSTNPVPTSTTNLVATSTELATSIEPASSTESIPSISAIVSPPPSTASPVLSTVIPTLAATPVPDPVLNEIMAAPNRNEEEWIELMLPFGASPLRYLDWYIEADNKLVFRFTTTTLQTATHQDEYLVASWKGSRLKNSGALVRLKREDGNTVAEVRYSTSTKGSSWMRDDLSDTWSTTNHPTRATANVFEAVPTSPPKTTPIASSSPTPKAVSPSVTPKPKSIQNASTATTPTKTDTESNIKTLEVATAPEKPSATSQKSTNKSATKLTTNVTNKPATKSATKKTSSKKSLVMPTSVTHFEHIPPEQLSPRVRVRLQGYVGSTVGVFGKQRFVLLAPDGRGLLVKATTQQPSPNLGESIELTGLLFANDEGVQLQMETSDRWKPIVQTTTSTPRVLDWNAPGIEDQWSLTKLEGLVIESRSSAITLESQVGEVTIPIKAVLGYRSQRVKPGDTIEVLGIFDGRSGQWKVQPSKAADIAILKHHEPEQKGAATSPSNTKLPWNAIGIAIGSIGTVEGIRRWLDKRKNTLQAKETPATILGA